MEAYRQMMEDTRLMMEMGIDPTSISTEPATEDKVEEPLVFPQKMSWRKKWLDMYLLNQMFYKKNLKKNQPLLVSLKMWTHLMTLPQLMSRRKMCALTQKKFKKGGCKPFFYLLGKRKGTFPKNGTTNKSRKSTRLLTPFYKLAGSELINKSLPMGNLKYRDSYPNPDESRIYSADGIAPTITAMHSDLHIWVGPRLDTPTEPTPLTDAA